MIVKALVHTMRCNISFKILNAPTKGNLSTLHRDADLMYIPVSFSPRSALTLSNKLFCSVERSADKDDCNEVLNADKER